MKVVGKVTEDEKREIESLFERKNGLYELAKILKPDDVELYERIVKDLGATNSKFQAWWDAMYEKYKWEGAENGKWEINFKTCEILLVI